LLLTDVILPKGRIGFFACAVASNEYCERMNFYR